MKILRDQLGEAMAAVDHERRARELDRDAAAERETCLRAQLSAAEDSFNRQAEQSTAERAHLLAEIVELSGKLQAMATPVAPADIAKGAWQSFKTRVWGSRRP
jgi:hypothetical protein